MQASTKKYYQINNEIKLKLINCNFHNYGSKRQHSNPTLVLIYTLQCQFFIFNVFEIAHGNGQDSKVEVHMNATFHRMFNVLFS